MFGTSMSEMGKVANPGFALSMHKGKDFSLCVCWREEGKERFVLAGKSAILCV